MGRNLDWAALHDPDADPDDTACTPYRGVPWSNLMRAASRPPGRNWFAQGAIENHPMILWTGPEKSCKSWLAIDLAISTVRGLDWLHAFRIVRPGPVVYLDGEYGEDEFTRRAVRLCRGRNLDYSTILPCINHLYSSDLQLNTADPQGYIRTIAKALAVDKPSLIVLDPFRNHIVGSENDADAVIGAMKALEMLRGDVKCPVLILHHVNKQGSMSGSRAIATRADMIFEADGGKDPTYTVRGRTLRRGDPITDPFQIELVHEHDQEDAIASTIVRRKSEESAELDTKILKLCREARTINKLTELIRPARSHADMRAAVAALARSGRLEATTIRSAGQDREAWIVQIPDEYPTKNDSDNLE